MADNSAAFRWKNIHAFIFFIGFALLATHELDAVAQSEWILLPVLNNLPADMAYATFVIGHVPLFAILMWLTAHPSPTIRRRSQTGLNIFLIAHAGLHWLMSDHSLYMFHTPLSTLLIFGGGTVGLLHLLMLVTMQQEHGRGA